MDLLETLKNDVKDYLGIKSVEESDLGAMLCALVAKHSCEIYHKEKELEQGLCDLGADRASIFRIMLMTTVSGFEKLIDGGVETKQMDLDRFVKNAERETGLNRDMILQLTYDIAISVGVAVDCTKQRLTATQLEEVAYVVPYSMYWGELQEFRKQYGEQFEKEEDLSAVDVSVLEPLLAMGLPEAKYYFGLYLIRNQVLKGSVERGVGLLKEAARAGNYHAAQALGDYYYESGQDKWDEAYSYYTGWGSGPLGNKREKTLMHIRKQKEYNRRLIGKSLFLFLVMVASLFLPIETMYPVHMVFGIFCMAGALAILGMSVFRHYKKPYSDIKATPVIMFGIWLLYIVSRIVFR